MSRAKRVVGKPTKSGVPGGYTQVLADIKRLIADSRHRALATVNRELVCLYWHIGRIIVQQQEQAKWGDAVVEQLSADLRMAFPDMKGFSRDNVFRMRQLYICLPGNRPLAAARVARRKSRDSVPTIIHWRGFCEEVGTASRQMQTDSAHRLDLSGQLSSPELAALVSRLSWSHHTEICSASDRHDERYFYMAMAVRERWSVRELRRQIDSALFLRYMSVQRDPEKCLPDDAESGDLLPFKDHYILEFLGLTDEHSERELRQAVLANLRDFFLEFGRDLTFVGDEYAGKCTSGHSCDAGSARSMGPRLDPPRKAPRLCYGGKAILLGDTSTRWIPYRCSAARMASTSAQRSPNCSCLSARHSSSTSSG